MKMYRLIAMLLAPSDAGYNDAKTTAIYNTIDKCIELGDRDTAIGLLLNFSVDSDNITRFDCNETYVLDADLDGVYLYKRL
jgi:hypothetical protein